MPLISRLLSVAYCYAYLFPSSHYINIDDKELNKFKLFKGDILVARSGATAGKVALFDLDLISVFASYLIRIQPNKEIDSSFLFYF